MGMGLVDDSQFERELNNVTNVPVAKEPIVLPITIDDSNVDKDIPTSSDDTTIKASPVISLDSPNNQALEGEIVDIKQRGRGLGSVQVPSTLRSLIAGTHHIEGRGAALEVAKEFGVSASSASAYANGVTSTASYNDKKEESIVSFVTKRKQRVTKKAIRVMTNALDKLTPDKLDTADAKELSGIAKDMSAIIGHFNDPKAIGGDINNNGPTFVLYAPQVKSEQSFNAIPSAD